MTQAAFDAAGYLRFDLASGSIESGDTDGLALLPLDLLATMTPGDETRRAAREFGEQRGKSLAKELSAESGLEPMADHLAGSLAVLGLGRAEIRIHGDALMFAVGGKRASSEAVTQVLAGFVAGYVGALSGGKEFEAVALKSEGGDLFWVGNPDAARRLAQKIDAGAEPLAAVEDLGKGGGR